MRESVNQRYRLERLPTLVWCRSWRTTLNNFSEVGREVIRPVLGPRVSDERDPPRVRASETGGLEKVLSSHLSATIGSEIRIRPN